MIDRPSHCEVWLHNAGANAVDHDEIERVSKTLIGALTSMSRTRKGEPMLVEKITVLSKLLAATLAALPDDDEGEQLRQTFYRIIGSTLCADVQLLRIALAKDGLSK